jgi:CheY-like chemotaxis protein
LSLTGNLEDLPLLDIVQIVSFSKKTGYLSIGMPEGEGGIVFREGLVVSAFTASSPPPDPRLGTLPAPQREELVRARVGFALEQLARLREGTFAFELTDEVPRVLGARDIFLETLARGMNPHELLLDLAQGMDDDRAQSAAAVEASFAAPDEGVVGGEESLVVTSGPRTAGGAGPPRAQETATPTERPDADSWAVPPRPGTDTQPLRPMKRPAPQPPLTEPPAPRPPATEVQVAESLPTSEGPVPAPAAPAGETEPPPTVLLVDDEDDVRGILGRHFTAAGFQIVEAGDPDGATKAAGRLRSEGTPFVLVTDLGMPASGGASFHGGFEVVKRLWKMNLRPPVLMMTESLNQSLRLRARQMGVQSFVFKPTLSKLNPRQFEADLSAFAFKLTADVLPTLAERARLGLVGGPRKRGATPTEAPVVGPPLEDARPFEFLRRRLSELRQPSDANQIAVLVMKVAREFFERAILFVVKNDAARGLGGFGLAPHGETINLLARQVVIPLTEASLFRDVAHGRKAWMGPAPADRWATHLMGRIGRFQSRGVALLPLVAHREAIALLFGDNPETGREPAGLEALEIFVQQAGIALENVFLQRKLQSLQENDAARLR